MTNLRNLTPPPQKGTNSKFAWSVTSGGKFGCCPFCLGHRGEVNAAADSGSMICIRCHGIPLICSWLMGVWWPPLIVFQYVSLCISVGSVALRSRSKISKVVSQTRTSASKSKISWRLTGPVWLSPAMYPYQEAMSATAVAAVVAVAMPDAVPRQWPLAVATKTQAEFFRWEWI